jgi:uncharacterized membrane protein
MSSLAPSRARLESIDALRGLVMVLMALDHARTFCSSARFPPEHLELTTPALFFTRWVTHLCAPLFFLLAGSAAWLYRTRAGAPALTRFLVTRGLWLIALELSVIGFAWSFVPGGSFAGVIWCLGVGFLSLAALLRAGPRALGALALLVIGAHGLLDDVRPEAFGSAGWLYAIAHRAGPLELPWGGGWFVLFPWIPWIAVMWLGYALGPLFERTWGERRRALVILGLAATALFVLLRATNAYGNPSWAFQFGGNGHFAPQATLAKSVIAFLNTEKYPASLQFLLMTLGPGLVLLGLWARRDVVPAARVGVLVTFGRTPFLFYLLHLYAFHLTALALGAWLGWRPRTSGAGLDLPGVYAVWLGVTALLYFPCAWWAALRARHDHWVLKYL